MSRADHDARNAAQVELLRQGLLGSGWSPSVWCRNPACAQPYPAELPSCPSCDHPNGPQAQPAPVGPDGRCTCARDGGPLCPSCECRI